MPIEALRNKAIAELAAFFVPEGVECLVYVQDGERPSDTRYFVGYTQEDGDVKELAVSKTSTIEDALPKLYDVLANKLLDAAKRCLPRK